MTTQFRSLMVILRSQQVSAIHNKGRQ